MSRQSVFDLTCTRCGRPVGAIDQEEYAFHAFGLVGPILCFDCEPDLASQRPACFEDLQESDLVDIGGMGFQVRDSELKPIGVSRARAHDTRMRACLSSSTYLNRTIKNWPVLESLFEYTTCPGCHGLSWFDGPGSFRDCEYCATKGEVLVPVAWVLSLIGGVAENA